MNSKIITYCLASAAALAIAATGSAWAQPTIKIGAPLPMTGALSPEGQRLKQGHDLWAETVNKAGGIQVGANKIKVEMVYADYQSNTPRAVQLADKLITQDKVDYIFSPFGSGATKAVSAVTEKNEVPNIAATASSVEVFNQGHKYIFGLFTPNDSLTEPLAELAKAKLPAGARVALLARNDLFPTAMAAELEKSAKKRGFQIVYNEKYALGAMDHSGSLVQVKSARPDWLFVSGYTNDVILIRKQMQDAGLAPSLLTMVIGPSYREFTESIGPLAENVTSAVWWHPVARYAGQDIFGSTEKYVAAFRQKYGAEPDYANAVGSLAGVVLQSAIEKAGTTERKAVRDQLAKMKLTTYFGPIAFDANGMVNSYVPPVFQIQGGRSVVVYPASIAAGSLK
jgi:branched-chain amino acid transport system substrate-binding protein